MTCAELELLLCDYIDGALRPEQRAEVEAHLAVCAACAELHRDSTGVLGFLERTAAVEPPPSLVTRILHQAPVSHRPCTPPGPRLEGCLGGGWNRFYSPVWRWEWR